MKTLKEVLSTLSPYKITWIEFKAVSGIATKRDIDVIEGYKSSYHSHINGKWYRHFVTREKAVAFLEDFNKKLGKRYECRLFTDKQYAMCSKANGYEVPFTNKQLNEVYYIG